MNRMKSKCNYSQNQDVQDERMNRACTGMILSSDKKQMQHRNLIFRIVFTSLICYYKAQW